jgi:hypothetical protein
MDKKPKFLVFLCVVAQIIDWLNVLLPLRNLGISSRGGPSGCRPKFPPRYTRANGDVCDPVVVPFVY